MNHRVNENNGVAGHFQDVSRVNDIFKGCIQIVFLGCGKKNLRRRRGLQRINLDEQVWRGADHSYSQNGSALACQIVMTPKCKRDADAVLQ